MSLFSDVEAEVFTLTNRQDLSAETKLAIKQATLDAHRSDYYPRDRGEIQVAINPASQLWQLDIPTVFANWRSFAALRPYTVLTGTLAPIVIGPNEFLAPDAILDEYLQEHLNRAYVAGTNLNIRLEAAYDGMLVVYYKNPIIAPEAAYNSWIAENQEFRTVIVIDAARRIFGAIGYEEAAARLNTLLFGSSQASWKTTPLGGAAGILKESCLESAGR